MAENIFQQHFQEKELPNKVVLIIEKVLKASSLQALSIELHNDFLNTFDMDYRNQIFAKAIVDKMVNLKEDEKAVVIVGSDHIPGLKQELAKELTRRELTSDFQPQKEL